MLRCEVDFRCNGEAFLACLDQALPLSKLSDARARMKHQTALITARQIKSCCIKSIARPVSYSRIHGRSGVSRGSLPSESARQGEHSPLPRRAILTRAQIPAPGSSFGDDTYEFQDGTLFNLPPKPLMETRTLSTLPDRLIGNASPEYGEPLVGCKHSSPSQHKASVVSLLTDWWQLK